MAAAENTELYRLSFLPTSAGASRGGAATPHGKFADVVIEPFLTLDCPALHGGVDFSQFGSKLAVGGHQMVSVFDYQTGGAVVRAQQAGRVKCVALSSDGACLAIGSFDRKLRLQAVEQGTQLLAFSPADGVAIVRSTHLSPCSTLLAVGNEIQGRGTALLFSATTNAQLHRWPQEKPVWSVRLSPDRSILAVGGCNAYRVRVAYAHRTPRAAPLSLSPPLYQECRLAD